MKSKFQFVGAQVGLPIWESLIKLSPSRRGPTSFQHLPLLAVGEIGLDGVARSSILRPCGLRRLLASSYGLNEYCFENVAWDALLPGSFVRALNDFEELDPIQRCNLMCCLNVMTEQRKLLRLSNPYLKSFAHDRESHRCLYEYARALIRMGRGEDSAMNLLSQLMTGGSSAELRLAAAVQFGAVSLRLSRDEEMAESAISLGYSLFAEVISTDPVIGELQASRLHRLAALFHTRRSEIVRTESVLDEAEQFGRCFSDRVAQDLYWSLVARENLRLVCEARVRLYSRVRNTEKLVSSCDELLKLDGEDPVAWQCVAEGAVSCGLNQSALVAAIVQGVLGGQAMSDTIEQLCNLKSDRDQDSDNRLRNAFLIRLGELYNAEGVQTEILE